MKHTILLTLPLALAACAPSQGDIETAIAMTQASVPTLTQVPWADVDLESLLIMEGDLPIGYSGGQIRSPEDRMLAAPELQRAAASVFQQFSFRDAYTAGGVAVFLFDSIGDRDLAYDAITLNLPRSQSIEGLGEKGIRRKGFIPFSEDPGLLDPSKGAELIFVRCHALAVVDMQSAHDLPGAISYAQRLDRRLQELVCR